MVSLNILVVSKEAWSDIRWARKQWLPLYLSELDSVKKVIYLDRHSGWWRGEKCHAPIHFDEVEVVQEKLLIPFERLAIVRQFNRKLIAQNLLTRLSSSESWFTLFYHPFDLDVVKHLKGRSKLIFDWTEDWAVFHPDHDIEILQQLSVKQADVVLTVTKELFERAVKWRGSDKDVFYLPNASALELPYEDTKEPALLGDIVKPRIGFVGHAGPWFDEKLVSILTEKHPNWHWVMIGGAGETAKHTLEGKGNIHWLGVHKPRDLMAFMRHCDVLVAPYCKGIQGDATKLYDYLLAGKPVLSTNCETAQMLQPWIKICDGADDWDTNLIALLDGKEVLDFALDIDVTKYQWPARAKQLENILLGLQS